MPTIRTDYLVVGGGAAGMAFTDSMLDASDSDVVVVERRHRPGGHWNDAYPFVRLHQPSAFYGVNSLQLGNDCIDEHGANAGLYERATGPEICAYFHRVLEQRLLPSGRLRFFGMSDYVGDFESDHRFVSRLTGESTEVIVRRRIVDARFLEGSIPYTHSPSFEVDDGVQFIPVNGLVDVAASGAFTVIGGGKTAMDACLWLLEQGVDPQAIRWIRPRDGWLLDRAYQQPLRLVPWLVEGVSLYLEAAAQAEGVEDLFRRLEACGQLLRLDQRVQPTMYRCATVSTNELELLRTIENVVRYGHVRRIRTDGATLANGSISGSVNDIYVDCSAAGLPAPPPRPVFEPGRITLQQIRACQPTFSAALVGHVEGIRSDDADKARLCPTNPYPNAAVDWIATTLIAQRAQAAWSEPDIAAWLERSRLNPGRRLRDHAADPLMQSALTRLLTNAELAIANLTQFADGHNAAVS